MDHETIKLLVDRVSTTLLAGGFLAFCYHMAIHTETKDLLTDWEFMGAVLAVVTGGAAMAFRKLSKGKVVEE